MINTIDSTKDMRSVVVKKRHLTNQLLAFFNSNKFITVSIHLVAVLKLLEL